MAAVVIVHKVRRTIIAPIVRQTEYDELNALTAQLNYRRLVVPPPVAWGLLVPWDEEDDTMTNVLCVPLRALYAVVAVLGILLTPFMSLIVLLCYPCVLCCSHKCWTNGFVAGQGQAQYYEMRLEAEALYPLYFSCLSRETKTVFDWLKVRGVRQEDCAMVDGHYNDAERCCVRIVPSELGLEQIHELHREDAQNALDERSTPSNVVLLTQQHSAA